MAFTPHLSTGFLIERNGISYGATAPLVCKYNLILTIKMQIMTTSTQSLDGMLLLIFSLHDRTTHFDLFSLHCKGPSLIWEQIGQSCMGFIKMWLISIQSKHQIHSYHISGLYFLRVTMHRLFSVDTVGGVPELLLRGQRLHRQRCLF